MQLADLVNSLAAEWEGLPVTPNSSGGYEIDFGDGLICQFSKLPDGRLLLEAPLGELPRDEWDCKALLEKLLQLNLAQQRERRSCVSLDEQGNRLVMFQIENADNSTDTDCERFVEDFLNQLEFWRRLVQTGPARSSFPAGLSP